MKKSLVSLLLALAFVAPAFAGSGKVDYKEVAKFTIGGEGGWDYLNFDPDGNRLFIAHGMNIFVVDASSGKKIGEMTSEGAHGVALVPEKNLGFFTNGRAGTVTVFDSKTLQPKESIKVGENPDAIIYDSHSKHVIVMNGRSKNMMAIDPSTLKVVADVPLGGKLEYAAADEGHVYINVEDTGEIAAVDSKTWKLSQRWKLNGCEEPSGLAIDLKQDRLFTVCGNKKMLVINAKDGSELASLPTGDGTDGAGYDPGLNLAFASNGEGTLTVVSETKDGKYEVAQNVTTARGARTMTVDPKTHKVYVDTAELGAPAEGQRRPSIKPGTFMVLVYAPSK